MKNKMLLLTGPGGSGKTTIARLLEGRGYIVINGDELDTEFFPKGGQSLPENKTNLKKAHKKIVSEAKKQFASGRNIVIEYIIFGEYQSFIRELKKEFGDSFEIKVLFPSEEETITRDKNRACWTTGPERIKAVQKELLNIRHEIGKENFVDTSSQTPEETMELLIK